MRVSWNLSKRWNATTVVQNTKVTCRQFPQFFGPTIDLRRSVRKYSRIFTSPFINCIHIHALTIISPSESKSIEIGTFISRRPNKRLSRYRETHSLHLINVPGIWIEKSSLAINFLPMIPFRTHWLPDFLFDSIFLSILPFFTFYATCKRRRRIE